MSADLYLFVWGEVAGDGEREREDPELEQACQ